MISTFGPLDTYAANQHQIINAQSLERHTIASFIVAECRFRIWAPTLNILFAAVLVVALERRTDIWQRCLC